MAGWFTKLMQNGHADSRRARAGAGVARRAARSSSSARDARHDAIVEMLRAREGEDRAAREKRQRWYPQYLKVGSDIGSGADAADSPTRLYRFATKVPCRATTEARALLDGLRKRFAGSPVSFRPAENGRQAVMVTRGGTEPKQIGWIEHCVQTDPKLCNVLHQGLSVETEGTMLVLRFLYPATAVRMSSARAADESARHERARGMHARVAAPPQEDALELPSGAVDDTASVDFAEIRPALDLRPVEKSASPRLVWLTRAEAEAIDALQSREYEAFYTRFKLEVLAGIWSALSSLLSSAPGSRWHRGSWYTIVREPDGTNGRIHQRTVDDTGRTIDIGADRTYDAAAATDILLLYLEGDLLADFADIYFTLQELDSADAYFLKEEFFTVVRRFWSTSHSLASRFGSDLATVVRMSQRAMPMPAQAPLLKQDWTKLRQSLVDRYGSAGRKATALAAEHVHRPRVGSRAWPFALAAAGEINLGLRVVYRQEWRYLGAQRGEVVRTVPPATARVEAESATTTTRRGAPDGRRVETRIEPGDAAANLDDLAHDALNATVAAMKWPVDIDGSINTGVRGLAATTAMGLDAECRQSSRETSARLGDIMQRMASRRGGDAAAAASTEAAGDPAPATDGGSADGEHAASQDDAVTYVYSRLQHRYELLTRPAELQNVVLVAEKLPMPAEIDLSWVRRHDWILAKALLDESYRDALDTIGVEARTAEARASAADRLDAKRDRLYEHVRANILHYQRAIWQHEDPQQRTLRYRKSGTKVPLDWRFELEAGGALTIEELGERLAASSVDGQFAAYSGGRETDLDRVIDPAGPIGYYGNYAVYHMRPEFGSADVFSMLHFFKCPYLRPNPDTNEPEVDDPLQIQIAADPAVVAASDRVIEHYREEMLRYLPELRRELAGARVSANDARDPNAAARWGRQPGPPRRHFATYLFRRERTRQIVLDTNGLVIDVVRRDDTAPEEAEHTGGGVAPGMADGYELILDGGGAADVLSTQAQRDAGTEWAIVADERTRSLAAGVAGVAERSRDTDDKPMIFAQKDAEPVTSLPGGTGDAAIEPLILTAGEGRLTLTAAGTGAARADERPILAAGGEEPNQRVGAAAAHEVGAAPVILAREGQGAAGLRAGSAPQPDEPPIVARGAGALRIAAAGASAADAQERLILSGADQERMPRVRAGRAREPEPEPTIVAQSGGEPTGALLAGRTHEPESEPLIVAREEGPRLTVVGGGGGAYADERAILAKGDEERMPKLLAGAGAVHARERMIVVRDVDWLRPSLIAG